MKSVVMMIVLTVCLISAGVASATTWVLVDDFSGTSVDTSIWDVTIVEDGSATIVDGRLYLHCDAGVKDEFVTGAWVTLKDTFSIADSEDSGVLSLAFDAEMGALMTRPYGNAAGVNTVAGDASRASTLFYAGGDKDINLDNGTTAGSEWLEKNFLSQPLHIQVAMSTSGIDFKVFNFQAGNTPGDYTDTTADLNDETAGSLIGIADLASGITGNTEELYLRLFGGADYTYSGIGDMFYDNVYTSIPEPATVGLLLVGGGLLLSRKKMS